MLLVPLAIATVVYSQGSFRPPSIPAIIAILRYQNSPCTTDSNTPGTCLAQNDCLARQGTPDGTCASGFASCCNFKFTCGGRTKENETIFVNHLYPKTDNGTNTCQVTIDKQPNVCQLRLGNHSMNQFDRIAFNSLQSINHDVWYNSNAKFLFSIIISKVNCFHFCG